MRRFLMLATLVAALSVVLHGQTLVGPIWIPDMNVRAANYEFRVMDASGEYVAWVMQVPKTGTLKTCEFNIHSVDNNPDNGVRVSFQDVSLTDGLPDGTPDQFVDITGTISTGWQVPGEMTDDGTGTGTPRSVTIGDLIACRVDFVSFTASDSVGIKSDVTNGAVMVANAFPYAVHNGSKIWDRFLNVALRYDDDSIVQIAGALPSTSYTSAFYGVSTTPDEYALRFQLPVAMRVIGAWAYMDRNNNPQLLLYNSAGSTLASVTLDADVQKLSAMWTHFAYFDAASDLAAATTYYLSLKPGAGEQVGLTIGTVNSNDLLGAWSGGASMYLATRTDSGAWTETTTQRPVMGLIVDAITTGGSGGEVSHPFSARAVRPSVVWPAVAGR